MATAVKTKTKRKATSRRAKPLSRQQLLERDPWHLRRQEDPVFRALLKVVLEHPKLVYYSVDWRPFYFGKADCPKEAALLKLAAKLGRPMVSDPDPICGSYFRAYNDTGPLPKRSLTRDLRIHGGRPHGGGYAERFASSIADMAVGPLERVSDAVVARLHDDYRSGLEAQRKRLGEGVYDADGNFVRRRRTPRPPQRARSFERMLRDAGFTPRLLGLLDREVERQRAATQQDQPPTRRKQCSTSTTRVTTPKKVATSGRSTRGGRPRATSPVTRRPRTNGTASSASSRRPRTDQPQPRPVRRSPIGVRRHARRQTPEMASCAATDRG